ncbi:hypothetical protein DM52_570 [Burkholderia mallei]|nr:hypothetical protein DM52_570 [Burkholderia mallei]
MAVDVINEAHIDLVARQVPFEFIQVQPRRQALRERAQFVEVIFEPIGEKERVAAIRETERRAARHAHAGARRARCARFGARRVGARCGIAPAGRRLRCRCRALVRRAWCERRARVSASRAQRVPEQRVAVRGRRLHRQIVRAVVATLDFAYHEPQRAERLVVEIQGRGARQSADGRHRAARARNTSPCLPSRTSGRRSANDGNATAMRVSPASNVGSIARNTVEWSTV